MENILKINVRNLFSKMMVRRRYLIVDEAEVTRVLDMIYKQTTMDAILDLQVGRCGWAWDRSKWFVYFNLSDEKWASITTELNRFYVLAIKDGTGNIFLTKKTESWS